MKGRAPSKVRIDDIQEAAIRTGKTLIFTLGVIKAAEIVFSKRFL